jgi:glycosyltransferase involved in cell wall biosynthesis
MQVMDITIILPVHNEVDNLRPLLREIEESLALMKMEFEVIAVDDGSNDGSSHLLGELVSEKEYLKVIVFRRNFGQAAAFDAGFRHASGNIVVTMDADLQNDPHDIPRMIAKLEEGYDFVAGRRSRRQDQFLLRQVPSRIANFIIRCVTKTRIHDLGCSLKVYRKEITDQLRLYGEMHRFIAVLVEEIGARTAEVDVNHRRRTSGSSTYGLQRTFKVLLDLVTVWFMRGYQTKPIYVFGTAGMLLLFASALLAGFVGYEKLALGVWVHRNPLFILAVVLFAIAIHFFGLGLLAEISVRTYFESQQKSTYRIGKTLGFRSKLPTADST